MEFHRTKGYEFAPDFKKNGRERRSICNPPSSNWHQWKPFLLLAERGFIGGTFSRIAIEKGYSIRIVDNFSSGSQEVAEELQSLGAEVIIGDIRDSKVDEFCNGRVDFVVHLAAQISVPLSMENPEETVDINVNGTQVVIDHSAIKHDSRRLVMASSAAVYGENTNLPLGEEDGGMLLSPYAESKWENEKQILESRQNGLESVALRFFNVYGVGQRPILHMLRSFQNLLILL